MSTPEVGQAAPDVNLPATGDQNISLASQKGYWIVLYFYPRDATPGCTTESQDFRDGRDRNASYPAPLAQIPACATNALGSYLG